MLLQSYDDYFSVFPAVPQSWKIRFAKVRVKGPFLVSGEFVKDKASYVVIESLREQKCRLLNPWRNGNIRIEELNAPGACAVNVISEKKAGTFIEFSAKLNRTYRIYPGDKGIDFKSVETLHAEERQEPRVISTREIISKYGRPVFFPDIEHSQESGQNFTKTKIISLGLPASESPPGDLPDPFRLNAVEFRKMVTNPSPRTRQRAVMSLSEGETVKYCGLLEKLLKDDDFLVRGTAAHKLAFCKDAKVIPALVKALFHADRQIRWTAIRALAKKSGATFGYDYLLAADKQKEALSLWKQYLSSGARS